jgi:KRAB domain-containing zinc finger protein
MENSPIQVLPAIKQEPEQSFCLILANSEQIKEKREVRGRAVAVVKKHVFSRRERIKMFETFVNCQICSKIVVNSEKSILLHMKVCGGAGNFQCDLCSYSSLHKFTIGNHMRKHCKEKCLFCGDIFARKSRHQKGKKCFICLMEIPCSTLRERHIKEVHKDSFGYYSCPRNNCGKSSLNSIESFRSHIRIHHSNKKHFCTFCTKQLSTVSYLKLHIKTVHAKTSAKFHCDLCSYESSAKHLLFYHMKRHSDERSKHFVCDRCGHETDQKSQLRKHLLRRPLTCSYCDEKFRCNLLYQEHCREVHHVKHYFWPCETCKSVFKRADALKQHQKQNRHGKFSLIQPEEIKCGKCTKTFITRQIYWMHLKRVHKFTETRKCNICLVTFSTAERLKAHLENHEIAETFKCQHCSFVTQFKRSLQEHVQKRHK